MKRFKVILLIFCIFQPYYVLSQTGDEAKELLHQFGQRFDELDSLIQPIHKGLSKQHRNYHSDDASYLQEFESNFNSALNKTINAEIAAVKSQTGLQVTGQTYYRLDEGFGLDEDDAESRYNGKAQAELRWSVFQSSLFKRKGKINEIRIKGEIDRLAHEKERLGMLVIRQKEYFRQQHDSLLCGILRHRIINLSLLSLAHDYLLRNENISSDELLNILNEKAEAERKLMAVGNRFMESCDLSCPVVHVIRIDTVRLLQHVREKQAELKTLDLRINLLEQQESNASYWNNADIAPFVRYSYYTRTALPNSSNIDAGVSFKLPISTEAKREKQTIRAKRELLKVEQNRFLRQVYDEVDFILNDIDRLNLSITGEYRRCKDLQNYLTVRKEAYTNRIGEYNRLARMKEYNSYLMCLEKMIEFQYQRDCQIANLARYLTDEPIEMFCYEEEIIYKILQK